MRRSFPFPADTPPELLAPLAALPRPRSLALLAARNIWIEGGLAPKAATRLAVDRAFALRAKHLAVVKKVTSTSVAKSAARHEARLRALLSTAFARGQSVLTLASLASASERGNADRLADAAVAEIVRVLSGGQA